MNWIELTASVFGIAAVWLTTRQNVLCWPVGLVQVSLYIYIFLEAKLYSDFILHIIYVVLQLYGWYHWMYGGQAKTPLPVTGLKPHQVLGWIALGVVGTGTWGFLMGTYTDAALPYPDAFTTVFSLIAQWLMVRKKIESWYWWLVVDVVAVFIYYHKELYFTVGLYMAFIVLCFVGWQQWQHSRTATSLS